MEGISADAEVVGNSAHDVEVVGVGGGIKEVSVSAAVDSDSGYQVIFKIFTGISFTVALSGNSLMSFKLQNSPSKSGS